MSVQKCLERSFNSQNWFCLLLILKEKAVIVKLSQLCFYVRLWNLASLRTKVKIQAEFVIGALPLEVSLWEQGLYKYWLICGERKFTSMPPSYPVWQMLVSAGNTGQWYLLHLNTLSKLLWLLLFEEPWMSYV